MALKPAAQNRQQLKPLISVIVGHRDFDFLNPNGQCLLLYETILGVNSMALSEAVLDTSLTCSSTLESKGNPYSIKLYRKEETMNS